MLQATTHGLLCGAADIIEANPNRYEFMESFIPRCGSPGCVLGWMGALAGLPPGMAVPGVAERLLGITDGEFYDRMDECADGNWVGDAAACVRTLRRYADKFHPEV